MIIALLVQSSFIFEDKEADGPVISLHLSEKKKTSPGVRLTFLFSWHTWKTLAL